MAHLAGALGVPVWLALPAIPDWRWLLHRDDSPWYPTMRLFRQRTRGDWTEVFGRIAVELKRRLAAKAASASEGQRAHRESEVIGAESAAPQSYDFTGIVPWRHIPDGFELDKAIALQQVVKQLGPGCQVVELGSFPGRSGVATAAVLPVKGSLSCVDPFQTRALSSAAGEEPQNRRELFNRTMEEFGVRDRIRVLAKSSVSAAAEFAAESVDLIFRNAGHDFPSVHADLLYWYPKLKPGGVLVCNNYSADYPGVAQGIDAFHLAGQVIAPGLWLHRKPSAPVRSGDS
jgi:predicted O-methyltransferase YrrM